jgi:hypothetical protein
MPGHYDLDPRRHGIQIQFVNIMQHVDGYSSGLYDGRLKQLGRPGSCVDIAFHHDNRRQLTKLREDLRFSHVPGMDNELGSAQRLNCGTAQ